MSKLIKIEEQIMDKWENLCLIPKEDNQLRIYTATILEKVENYLKEGLDNDGYGFEWKSEWHDKEKLVYPIITRICTNIYNDILYLDKKNKEHHYYLLESLEPSIIVKKIMDAYLPCLLYVKELNKYREVDIEAQTCSKLAEDIANIIIVKYYFDNLSTKKRKTLNRNQNI